MAEIGMLYGSPLQRVPWVFWALLPVLLQATILRRRGGYYYRNFVAMLCLAVSGLYGVFASIALPIFGKGHLINWTVARVHKLLNKRFLDIGANVIGTENFAKHGESAVYVGNHQAVLDVVYLGSFFPKNTAMVAKKAVKYYPFLGWFMILSKAIFLDRGNREDAVKQARKAAEDIHKQKTAVFLYPEGTRSGGDKVELLPFKKGAFYMATQAKVPVIPIVVENYKHIFNSKSKHFGYGDITIKVLPPIDTTDVEEDSASISKLAENVRGKMLTALEEISTTAAKEQ